MAAAPVLAERLLVDSVAASRDVAPGEFVGQASSAGEVAHPELIGESAAGRRQEKHEYLYWEFVGQTAVRSGNWKAIQPKAGAAGLS